VAKVAAALRNPGDADRGDSCAPGDQRGQFLERATPRRRKRDIPAPYMAFVGPQAIARLNALNAEVAIVGCDGLTSAGGLTTPHQLVGGRRHHHRSVASDDRGRGFEQDRRPWFYSDRSGVVHHDIGD
jgi:hypothetical protein